LIINTNRFDSWAALALIKSSVVIEKYLENGFYIKNISDCEEYERMLHMCINLFRKSIELRPFNDKLWIEYGLYLYQMHSYCSRQLKINNIIGSFGSDYSAIINSMNKKKNLLLSLALDAYLTINQMDDNKNLTSLENIDQEENLSSSNTSIDSLSSNDKKKVKAQSSKQHIQLSSAAHEEDESSGEEWLHHYMLGKIKEKQSEKFTLIDCLKHYEQSQIYLDKSHACYLKKLTYKTKDHLSVEANEVYYRIYALTLKRLTRSVDNLGCFKKSEWNDEKMSIELLEFLKRIMSTKFVRVHNDFQLNEVSSFLHDHVFPKSRRLAQVNHRSFISQSLCICIAGLNQILKRFGQHYRSIYRLAHFYSHFIDLSNNSYDISKNLFLSTPGWSALVYMPCQGLFAERHKTNYFNGIWRNSNCPDIERGGSFYHHLFEIVRLHIEILDKACDSSSLIELAKCLYLKPEPDKKFLDDFQQKFFADLCLLNSLKLLEDNSNSKFRTKFNDLDELSVYQNEFVSILLDAYEIYKLSQKNYQMLTKNIETLMFKLYIQFHPEMLSRIEQISSEEMVKFCQLMEKRDRAVKASQNKSNKSKSVQIH
jgi:hypothetical protein